jgi:hypothetical protein
VQRGPPHAAPRLVPVQRVRLVLPVQVADAAQRMTGGIDAERGQPPDGGGGQALTASLVQGRAARFGHRDRQARLRAADRRRQPGRAAPDDQHVDHDRAPAGAAAASARVSQRIRTVSSAALSAVNAAAVIQADPTSGSAAPSTITAA